jgi:hypothetical protein
MISSRTLGLGLLALLTASACRPREGERCICAGECAGGLVCAADGAILRDGQCVSSVSNDLESGVCVDGGNVSLDDDSLTPPPKFDAGSWATSGSVPVTTASDSDSDATTMPDEGSSTSEVTGDSTSSSSGGAESSSSSTGGSSESGASGETETTTETM